jgi:D-amino-acid oxidase
MPKGPLAHVAVAGSGVAGLASADKLLQAGFPVTMYTKGDGCSEGAGAFWYPDSSIDPRYPTLQKSGLNYWAYEATGIAFRDCLELGREEISPPAWDVPGCRTARQDELIGGYTHGLVMPVFVITPRLWLDEKLSQLRRHERFRYQLTTDIKRAEDLFDRHRIVVNCTGLDARTFIPDPKYFPVRGYVVHVKQPKVPIHKVILVGGAHTWVVPHGSYLALGGMGKICDESTETDNGTTWEIIQRNEQLLGCKLAARPQDIIRALSRSRPAHEEGLQLQSTQIQKGFWRIDNCGHRGAGYSLAGGCADEVVAMVLDANALINQG